MLSDREIKVALFCFIVLLVVGLGNLAALGYVMGVVLAAIMLGRFLILPYVALHRIFDWGDERGYVEPPDRPL